MKIVNKIFYSLFLSCAIISSTSLFFAYNSYITNLEEQFLKRYGTFSDILGESLTQLEIKTDLIMSFAGKLLQKEDKEKGLLSTEELKVLSKKLNMSHLFIISSDGKFIRSTNEDPINIPNLFSFCESYKDLLNDAEAYYQTPIIQPYPEPKPYKFLIIPNLDRSRLMELGLKADYIGQTVTKALNGDKNLEEISIYSPNGQHLGSYTSSGSRFSGKQISVDGFLSKKPRWNNDHIIFTKKATASQPICCQCKKAQLVGDNNYYYLLQAKISTTDFMVQKQVMKNLFVAILLISLLISVIVSHILSRTIMRRLDAFNKQIITIVETKNLSFRSNVLGKDEVSELSKNFDHLLQILEEYNETILGDQKKIADLDKKSAIFQAIASTVHMVAHDVRQPLDMVSKFVKRMGTLSFEQMKSTPKETLQMIEKAINNTYGMLEDLIDFSPNKMNLVIEPVALKPFFEEIAVEFSNVTISISDESLGIYYFDRLKIKRVLINIVKNAVEATKGHATYWIIAKNKDNDLEIEIGNLGSKIDPEKLTNIFEPFFTVGKLTGHGLGMSIAKKFTEEHGGKIWCESNGCSHQIGSIAFQSDKDYVLFTIRIPQNSLKLNEDTKTITS